MDILLSGISGHMGPEVLKLAHEGMRGARVVGGVALAGEEDFGVPVVCGFAHADEVFCGPDASAAVAAQRTPVDVIVDFSHHELTADMMAFAVSEHIPVVVATTGQTDEERDSIFAAAEHVPVFFAANFSLGVALLIELAKKAAAVMNDADIEIVEYHHNRKLDAPSGTALAIANGINEARDGEMHLVLGRSGHNKREAKEIGISAVRMGNVVGKHEVFIATNNEIITLTHEAQSRAVFAEGALAAAEFVLDKDPGMYDMRSIAEA